jgi:hypothetical protein
VELLKLYEYSAEVKDAAASDLTKNDLLRDFGPIVFEEDSGDYSYALDPTQIESIINALDLDTKHPNIKQVEIESTDGQEFALYVVLGRFTYEFTYEVNNGYVTPIAYRDLIRGRTDIVYGGFVIFVVFLLSIAGFVLWGAWDDVKQKAHALQGKSRIKEQG